MQLKVYTNSEWIHEQMHGHDEGAFFSHSLEVIDMACKFAIGPQVRRRLSGFSQIQLGDFSREIPFPEQEDPPYTTTVLSGLYGTYLCT